MPSPSILAASVLGFVLAAGNARADAVSDAMAQKAQALRAAWLASGRKVPSSGEPQILSGTILTPAVSVTVAPGQATVSLEIAPGSVGASAVSVGLVSPSGQHTVSTIYAQVPSYPVKSKFALPVRIVPTFGSGFNLYSEPGAWMVNALSISSIDGNTTAYNAAEIAAIFGNNLTVQVTNDASPDTVPPTYTKGKILTPTVSLSATPPVFAVKLAVADAISGVNSVFVEIEAPGQNFPTLGASSVLDAPVQKGDVIAYTDLNATDATGTYTIAAFDVCDYAGNCVSDSTPADIQKTFGSTTFEVTN